MINLLYIDLFCGAGGTSSGVEYARVDGDKCAKVVACVNHDRNAILSHQANHPDALHFTEDIRTLELSPMVEHLHRMKTEYPDAYVVLWASLECTNFSRAKGGQPRDADSRTLAEHLFRYIEALRPDYMQIENVEEFMCWGELDEHGKPISRHKGTSYIRWVKHVCDYGYTYDWHLLNAADFGAYTSRKRFFGQFARKGLPIAFPAQTHAKATVPSGSPDGRTLFPDQYRPWKPVREVLDSQYGKGKPSSIDTPAPTVVNKPKQSLVSCSVCGDSVAAKFLLNPQFNSHGSSIDKPCFTLIARMDKMPPYLVSTVPEGSPSGEPQLAIVIYDTDSPMTRKVKEFMAAYGLIDIRMRMLKISELKRIMGFPDSYILVGTQAEQKKYIGNAVEVNMSRVLCEALSRRLQKDKKLAV